MRSFVRLSLGLVVVLLVTAGCSFDADRPTVIVDTDMGFDDVRALLLLLESDDVDVVAVTVAGNGLARCPQAGSNARAILNLYDLDAVPVACGSPGPLEGFNLAPTAWRDAADALAGMQLERGHEVPDNAPELIVEVIAATNQPVTVLTLGPLTNLAKALALQPDIITRIADVRVMGGAVDVGGNILDFEDPVAEFNIWFDPLAAHQVLESGVTVTLVPLDATNDVPITPFLYDVFMSESGDGTASSLMARFVEENPFTGGIYHWDDLAAATLIDESLVEFDERRLAVVLEGDDQGRTVSSESGTPMRVAVAADRSAFESLFYGTLVDAEVPDVAAWEPDGQVLFDGQSCTYKGPDPLPPQLDLHVDNQSDRSALGVLVVEYDEGTTSEQIQAFNESNPTTPPPFFTLLGVAPMLYRTSSVWSYQPTAGSTLLCVVTIADTVELAGVRIASS